MSWADKYSGIELIQINDYEGPLQITEFRELVNKPNIKAKYILWYIITARLFWHLQDSSMILLNAARSVVYD